MLLQVSTGRVLQRGIDLAQSKFVILLHFASNQTPSPSSVPPEGDSLLARATTLLGALREWDFSVENLLTPVFRASTDVVVFHGSSAAHAETSQHLVAKLDSAQVVALGFVQVRSWN